MTAEAHQGNSRRALAGERREARKYGMSRNVRHGSLGSRMTQSRGTKVEIVGKAATWTGGGGRTVGIMTPKVYVVGENGEAI